MSDDLTTFVPKAPFFIASNSVLSAAKKWLLGVAPNATQVEVMISEKPQFYDAGANFESISCPQCGQTVSLDWWGEQMDADFEDDGFKLGRYETPCCQAFLTLNDFHYDSEQAFGVCAIQGTNLGLGGISEELRKEAEGIIGTPLIVVYSPF